MPFRSRATAKLLPGRFSSPGACYFLTWCTQHRAKNLAEPGVRQTVSAAITGLEESGDGALLAATAMPDHVHLLLRLGARLTVSQVVSKVKASVTRRNPTVKWQLNFFEHRLRDATNVEHFALYIFMNPYTAGLCDLDDTWPGWISSHQIRWSFEDKLRAGRFPHAEWLSDAARFARTLPADAD